LEQVNNIVYLSFADIRDAVAFYNAIAKHHDNMAVEFIQGNDLNEVGSTNTDFLRRFIANGIEDQESLGKWCLLRL
jgi:hypothetical protein